MYQKWLKILAEYPLFQKITATEMSGLLNCLQPRINLYQKNSYVILEGEAFSGVGLVLTGEVVITRDNAKGNRLMMTKLGAGELFGEIAAFSGQLLWPATVLARESCQIMFVPTEKILDNCEKHCGCHRQLIINALKIVARRAFMLNKKVNYLTIKSLRGKISHLLWEQYQKTGRNTFMLPMKRQECAEFLNVSRPALSREICRMRDEGIIEFHRQSIRIKDPEVLKTLLQD